jgi:hypothetical protein
MKEEIEKSLKIVGIVFLAILSVILYIKLIIELVACSEKREIKRGQLKELGWIS